PLQQAIFIGAGLSIVLYAVSASRRGRIVLLTPVSDGGWVVKNPPQALPSHQTTVLHYDGPSFFAEVNRLEDEWPATRETLSAPVGLSLRGSGGFPSATSLKPSDAAAHRLQARDIDLVLCGVSPSLFHVLERSRALDVLGEDSVFLEAPHLMDSLTVAYATA